MIIPRIWIIEITLYIWYMSVSKKYYWFRNMYVCIHINDLIIPLTVWTWTRSCGQTLCSHRSVLVLFQLPRTGYIGLSTKSWYDWCTVKEDTMVLCVRFSQVCLVLLVPKCRYHKDVGKLLLILPGKSQMSNFETPCLTAISTRKQKSRNPR